MAHWSSTCKRHQQDELYNLQTDDLFTESISPRNEAVAPGSTWQACQTEEMQQLINKCYTAYAAKQKAPSPSHALSFTKGSSAEDNLHKWAVSNGVTTLLQPALFDGGVRGLAATTDLPAGSEAVVVPQAALISHETAKSSDLGPVLTQFPQLADDSIAVIWTMVDRHDEESPRAPFWQSLPSQLHSGFAMSDCLLQTLQGTPGYAEICTSRKHVRQQYEDIRPILEAMVVAYPAYMQPEWFTWEAYLWAVQLWYAYAMQVRWPDGSSQECLVPYASLLNHSPYPHIIQYGQLDTDTGMLCFPLFRPNSKNQQCFLSYGPLPNLKLLLFYGIATDGNPHDAVPLQLQIPNSNSDRGAELQGMLASHKLTLEHKLCAGRLPVALLQAASVLGSTTLQAVTGSDGVIDIACSRAKKAQRTVLSPALAELRTGLQHSIARTRAMQELGESEAMLDSVCTYLSGQAHIVDCAVQQLNQHSL